MKSIRYLIPLILLFSAVLLLAARRENRPPAVTPINRLLQIDAQSLSLSRTTAVSAQGTSLASLSKSAPATAAPGRTVTYQISLDNLDAITHTFALTDTLPVGLRYVDGSASGGLNYDAANRRLTWSGQQGPGTLGYKISEISALPYLTLSDLGATNLCGQVSDCDEGSVSFDLAALAGGSVSFFDETGLTQLVASTNGFLYGPEGWQGVACAACPQPLPHPTEPNQLMAGLWYDLTMAGGFGGWYAAIVENYPSSGTDAFYIQWHDAIQTGNPFLSSRHAIALVLDGQLEPAGRIYLIYDNITDSTALEDVGYSIGLEDKTGSEGLTYAYARCHSAPCLAGATQGQPPANGTTLMADRAIVGGSSARIFTYQVEIEAPVGTIISNQVEMSSDGPVSSLTAVADLLVTYRSYFPFIGK